MMSDTIDILWRNLGPFLDQLRGEKRLADNTVVAYASDVKSFISFLKDEAATGEPLSLSAETIRGYCLKLGSSRHDRLSASVRKSKYAASSQERRLVGLKNYLRFLHREGCLEDDFSRFIELPRKPKHLPVHLSRKEVEDILEAATGNDFRATRNLAILEILYATGCRVSEVAGMNIDSVDIATGSAMVLGKGSKERKVIFGDFASRAIGRYLMFRLDKASHGEQALFVNKNGKRLSVRGFQRIVKQAGILANLAFEITPHALRHSFATHMLSGGADLRTIQELLGHSSLSTVQKYTHLETERLREVHSKTHPLGDG